MTTFRRAHKKNYTVITNEVLRDSRLSFRARGVLGALLSYPDDWAVSVAQLEKQSPKEGRDAIKSALKELETLGYLVRSQSRAEAGKFSSIDYLVFETPQTTVDGLAVDGKSAPTVDGLAVDGLAVDGKSAPTKYYKDEILSELSTPPTPQRGDESESVIFAELVSDLATVDPFLNRRSGLSYQKEKALAESLVGSPFDSIEAQDEFYSQFLDYLRATSPKLDPGQITGIAKAALKRIMNNVPDPEDRRVLALWQKGQLEQFRGMQYDGNAKRRSDTKKRLEETAAKYLAEKERENAGN